MSPPSSPPAELLAWAESVAGQPVGAVRPMDRWRPTWFIDVGTGPRRRQLLLKTPRAPAAVVARSAMLRHFGLDREGDSLEILRGSDVPVPDLVGRQPHRALLLGVVPGTGQVTSLPPAQRRSAMQEYGRILARLHQLDHQPAVVAGFAGVAPPWLPGPLRAAVDDWGPIRAGLEPEPLIDLGLGWLRRHVPTPVDHRLVHGDAGSDQFMVHDGRVAAVLDWELAHLGDPASDLGYSRFREALYPTGAYDALLDGYSEGGGSVDPDRIGWYSAVAALVMLVGVNRGVQRPRITNPEAAQRLWWDALARMALCQILDEQSGGPSPRPSPASAPRRAHPAAERVGDLLGQCAHVPGQAAARTRAQLLAAADRLADSARHGQGTSPLPLRPAGTTALDNADLLHDLTAEAGAGVWALAPLSVLDRWGDSTVTGWDDRLLLPVLPPIPPDVAGSGRREHHHRGA